MEKKDRALRVELDPAQPLFMRLVELCAEFEARHMPIRLIGGGAMLLWAKCRGSRQEMTQDLDCALLSSDVPNPDLASEFAREVIEGLNTMGFHPIMTPGSPEWKASRRARFCYGNAEDHVQVEFLCGELPHGGSSRRKPAWRVAAIPEGPHDFYAARVPAIDFVSDWIAIKISAGESQSVVWVPDVSGLVVLKLKALHDKMIRLGEELSPADRIYEYGRLRKHGADAMQLIPWLEEDRDLHRLGQLVRKNPPIRGMARDVSTWARKNRMLMEELGLSEIRGSLDRIPH